MSLSKSRSSNSILALKFDIIPCNETKYCNLASLFLNNMHIYDHLFVSVKGIFYSYFNFILAETVFVFILHFLFEGNGLNSKLSITSCDFVGLRTFGVYAKF